MNNFNERLETYLNFIRKRRGNEHLEIIIRELKKFYQLGIDDFYPESQRKTVIKELIKEGESRSDQEERAVFFLFAYKLNKANRFDLEVPILYLDETLIVNDYPQKMPESVLKTFRDKDREYYAKMYKEYLPDKEALEVMTDLSDRDEVYAEISKEDIAKLFADAGAVAANDDGEKDDSYVSGEVQFFFSKEGELNEILIAPVYETEDGYVNGESIDAPEALWKEEKKAKKYLDDKLKPAKKKTASPAVQKPSAGKKVCDGSYVVLDTKMVYVTYEGSNLGKVRFKIGKYLI